MSDTDNQEFLRVMSGLQSALAINNRLHGREAIQGSTNRPYYREVPALDFKQILDNLVRTRATQALQADDGHNFTTHCNKISQCKKYLLDHLDPEKYYATLLNHIEIKHQEKTRMTYIKFKSTPMLAESVPDFAPELDKFLTEAGPESVFERTGLSLNTSQLAHFQAVASKLDERWVTVMDTSKIIVAKIA